MLDIENKGMVITGGINTLRHEADSDFRCGDAISVIQWRELVVTTGLTSSECDVGVEDGVTAER